MNDDQEEVTAIIRKCRICGFTWNEGTLGSHDCNDVKAARYEALRKAVQAAFDCGMIPNSSANNGGAAKHSRQVHVADMLRAAMNQGD